MAIDRNINQADIQHDIANDIVKAVVSALHTAFGDAYTYYAEEVPQGFIMPSFAAMVMSQSRTSGMDIQKMHGVTLDIQYFCASGLSPRGEWNTVEQRMSEVLDWVDAFGKKLRGNIQPSAWDAMQNVGHFYISFTIPLLDVYEEADRMEALADEDGNYIAGDKSCLP